jgi:hypothetical protein
MKNILKYIFISFGLLFLGSFFFVEESYAAVYCYDDSDCSPSTCNLSTNTCRPLTCPSSCLCGCYSGTASCKPQTNVATCECGGTLCGGCNPVYTDEASCTCGYWTKCGGCQLYDVSGCFIEGDPCTGECGDLPDPTCQAYSCDPGYTPVWNPVSESCVCARTTTECEGGYAECGSTCCPPGTYCGADSSGGDICIGFDEDPEPPEEDPCTDPDITCEPTDYCSLNGWTSTPTPYLLEDVVFCDEYINCVDIVDRGDCYEDPDNPGPNPLEDIQTLRVTMGSNVSSWIQQQLSKNVLERIFQQFIPKIYAQSATYTTETDLGFVNNTASGLELNNPLPVEARYTDTDGVEDIEAIYFWMTREDISPLATGVPRYIDTIGDGSNAQTEYISSFGFMVRRTGNDWSNAEVYLPENVDAGDYWVSIGDFGETFFIYGPNGLPMVRISSPSVSVPSSDDVVLTFDLEFLNERSGVAQYEKVYEDTYKVYAMVHDVFGFTPWDNYTYEEHADLNRLRDVFSENEIREYDEWEDMGLEWSIDLTPPEVDNVNVSVTGDTELGVTWSVTDAESGIGYVVGNAYRNIVVAGQEDSLLYTGPDAQKVYEIPEFDEDLVGSLLESNLWKVDVLGSSVFTQSRTDTVDIQGNNGGLIDFYVTVFDEAGNYDSLSDSFNLGSWLISKGGLVYSTGGTNIAIRLLDFSEGDGWPGDLWYSPDPDAYPDATVFDHTLVDLSTEVLSGNVDYEEDLYNLPHSVEIDGVKNLSVKVLQNAGLLRNSVYQIFKDRAENQLSSISAETISISGETTFTGNSSDYCSSEYCVINTEYNLTFASGFVCDNRLLVMTSGDITVQPNITNSSSSDGCIFVSGDDIVIEEGTYASDGNLEPLYDLVEGFFLADGTILVEAGDMGLDVKDGLQVNGGLVAFGGTQSVIVGRNMKLVDKAKYPALGIHSDVRYGKIALEFFGPERSVYKQEVGYKPF